MSTSIWDDLEFESAIESPKKEPESPTESRIDTHTLASRLYEGFEAMAIFGSTRADKWEAAEAANLPTGVGTDISRAYNMLVEEGCLRVSREGNKTLIRPPAAHVGPHEEEPTIEVSDEVLGTALARELLNRYEDALAEVGALSERVDALERRASGR